MAEILSTNALSRRAILPIPLSSIVRCAITEVKRSSWKTTSLSGQAFRRRTASGSMKRHVSEGVPSMREGFPTTMVLTSSEAKYFASHASSPFVSTVSSPPAIRRSGSLTAIPVRFVP